MLKQPGTYRISLFLIGIWTLFLTLFSSCTAKKFIGEGSHYFDGYEIHLKTPVNGDKKSLLYEELDLVTEVKPTPKFILGSRPRAWNYYKYQSDTSGIKGWRRRKIGKAPVFLSDVPVKEYVRKIRRVLEIEGFYHSKVTAKINKKNKHGNVVFDIETNDPMRIRFVEAHFEDTKLEPLGFSVFQDTKMHFGDILSLTELEEERSRITRLLHDSGYFYMGDQYLLFEVDSTNGYSQSDVFLRIKESTPEDAMVKYTTGDIVVYPDFNIADTVGYTQNDKETVEGVSIISNKKSLKNNVLRKYLHYEIGDETVLTHSDHEHTLHALGSLEIYKLINAIPEPSMEDTSVNITLYLTPEVRNSLKAEVSLISKSNNFTGPGISLSHVNKNAFRGAEKLRSSLKFAYETQLGGVRSGLNAFEFGLESNLEMPGHILPMFSLDNSQLKRAHSSISGSYNYQKRVNQFALNSINASYYFNWQWKNAFSHRLGLLKLTYLRVSDISDAFQAILDSSPILKASFQDNTLPEMDYEFTYRPEKRGKVPHYLYMHANIAGNTSNWLYDRLYPQDSVHAVFGVPITQFVRLYLEGRKYHYLRKDMLAFRMIAGAGLAYGNSESLPYQKQFFAGGANSIRAFPSRLVGPGTVAPGNFSSSNTFLDQTGDMRLELNGEYRMKVNSILELAGFIDAGNIWLLREDTSRPGARFEWDNFYNQLAIGTGVGTRFDFEFFVIRLDLAFPLRVPYNDPGNRWVITEINPLKSDWRSNNLILNLAIGHPF